MTEKPTNITANKKTRELTINWDEYKILVIASEPFGRAWQSRVLILVA